LKVFEKRAVRILVGNNIGLEEVTENVKKAM
jgi:hypothetical protein